MVHLYLLNDDTHAMIESGRRVSRLGADAVIQGAFRVAAAHMTPDELRASAAVMRAAAKTPAEVNELDEYLRARGIDTNPLQRGTGHGPDK